MPTLKLPLPTSGDKPKRPTSERMRTNPFPSRVTPRSITNPLTRSVVIRPPTRRSASSTSGSTPRSFRRRAAASPAIPPPITITSASPLWVPIGFSLAAPRREEIDGLSAARVLHVIKTVAQEFVPILALGHVMDHRAEDHVVVRVPPVFEQKYPSSGLQDAVRLAEQFFSRSARGNLVRPEPKTDRIAGGIRQRQREVVRLGGHNSRVARGRHFQVAHILYSFFGLLAFHVPAIHGLNGGFRQHVGEQESVAIGSDVQVRDGHLALYTAQFHQAAHVAHSRMTVHAI